MTLAAGMTLVAGMAMAKAADTTGCTPQEKSAQTLNQKLNETQGVICPPDVTPAAPAIPAPGTPGGERGVQPK